MDSVFLVLPAGARLADVLDACRPVAKSIAESAFPDRYVVEVDDWHVYIGLSPDVLAEFEEGQLSRIHAEFGPDPVLIEIEFSRGPDRMFTVLREILPRVPCLVENDRDLLVTGQEYLERIQDGTAMEWGPSGT